MGDNASMAMIELVDFNNLYNSEQSKKTPQEQVVDSEEKSES